MLIVCNSLSKEPFAIESAQAIAVEVEVPISRYAKFGHWMGTGKTHEPGLMYAVCIYVCMYLHVCMYACMYVFFLFKSKVS